MMEAKALDKHLQTQKIVADKRPSDYEYARLSQHVYGGSKIQKGEIVTIGESEWKVHAIQAGQSSYFGAIYINRKTQQVVLAHQGTYSIGALVEDLNGIYLNGLSPQKKEIFSFIQIAIELAKEQELHLSFTGHSLGAFLAELSVYYSHRSHQFSQVSAVTFESPGCRESLEALQPSIVSGRIDLDKLDMVSYLSYPNLVNTCNHHIGTLFTVEPNTGKYGDWQGWHLLQVHSIDNTVTLLADGKYTPQFILDWPMGGQRDYFFKHAQFNNGHYVLPTEEQAKLNAGQTQFALHYQGHYQLHTVFNNRNTLPLIHCSPALQQWLKDFYEGFRRFRAIEGDKAVIDALKKLADTNPKLDEAITYLLAGTLTANQNGALLFQLLVDITVNDTPLTIWEFRRKLSCWLEENPKLASELLKFVYTLGRPNTSEEDLRTVLIEKGAVIEQTGVIVKGVATTIYQAFPQGTSDKDIQHLKDLSEHQFKLLKQSGLKTKVIAIENGAIIKGTIHTAVSAQVYTEITGPSDRPAAPLTPVQLMSGNAFICNVGADSKTTSNPGLPSSLPSSTTASSPKP